MPNTNHISNDPGPFGAGQLDSTGQFDGREAVELLPWLINGSLETDEAQLVQDQLGPELDSEIAATREMFWLTGQHLSSMTLTEYALGLPTTEMSRDEIEAHLAVCSASRAELELIRADISEEIGETASEEVFEEEVTVAPIIDFTSARQRRVDSSPVEMNRPAAIERPKWRVYALAAALATAVAGALLVQVAQDMESAPVETAPMQKMAQFQAIGADVAESEMNLRSSKPDTALFFDGFESGDTGGWSTVSN